MNNTCGASRLVTLNSIIKPIPTTIVNNSMKQCDFSDKSFPVKNKKVDQVKILNGRVTNFIATV
jgi:hypothetical protein